MKSNIIDFRDSESMRQAPSPKKKSGKVRRVIFVITFLLLAIYLTFTVIKFINKDTVSIYEVQAEDLSYDNTFRGLAIRDEKLVYADYAGYISYYVRNKKKSAKSSIVYSIDSSSKTYDMLNESFSDDKLDAAQINEIKSVISRYFDNDSSTVIANIGEFNTALQDIIYDFVNNNMIKNLQDYVETGLTGTSFHVCRTPYSGVISYKSDNLNGLSADSITADMFEDNYPLNVHNLKSTGLISATDPVYRICPDENWSVVCKVPEDFFINNIDTHEGEVLIGEKVTPLKVSMRPFQTEDGYYIELSLNKYMSEFIDDRILTVRFINDKDTGLKIPTSAIVKKEYYLVPQTVFSYEEENDLYYLLREQYDESTGKIVLNKIYPTRYYFDGYYAYIDTNLLNDGDYVQNISTSERVKISITNTLDGVYNVNKGYYQFVRIDKLETGDDYVIISGNTPGGIRQFDHIALDASKGVESALIL